MKPVLRKTVAVGLGLGLLLAAGLLWMRLLTRQDRLRLVPHTTRLPSRLAAVAERDGSVFGMAWVRDPAALLDAYTRMTGRRPESPVLTVVLGGLARDALLFGLREPHHPRGWTAVALLKASPAMERALPRMRSYLPAAWHWQDRTAAPGCTGAFELTAPMGRWAGQFCAGYLVIGEAGTGADERLWQVLRVTANVQTSVGEESASDAPPSAAVVWLRLDRLPESLRPTLPESTRPGPTVPGRWTTLTLRPDSDRLEVRIIVPLASDRP